MDKVPVIFLDRDGTINEEVNYLYKPEELRIFTGVSEAIRMLREAGYKIIVITNQAGVARGYYTEADVTRLHDYLNRQLAGERAHIDAFYYCPHHPEHGLGSYRVSCSCRKPGTGMFEMAEQDFPVDKERSWMVGDKLIDAEAGHAYGIRTVLVGTGYGQEARRQDVEGEFYDIFAETLMDAAKAIIRRQETEGDEPA